MEKQDMRITEKDTTYITSGANVIQIPNMVEAHKYTGQAIIKLGQLEDIEEELGIDLITLFKALKNGIWSKRGDKIEKIEITDNLRLVLDCNGSTDKVNWWLLDYYDMNGSRTEDIDNWWVCKYGIEWALTKEELEKQGDK